MNWREFLARFRPEAANVPWPERLRAAAAAAVGVALVAVLSALLLGSPPFLVASVGASAVLVFGLPASPFAQPWSVAGGYLVCALAGVLAAKTGLPLPWAAGLAVGLALVGMFAARCIHPPGGAVALFAVIGGEKVAALGFQYVLAPVMLNAVLMVAAGLAINNLIPGRRYPRPHPEINPHQVKDAEPLSRLGLRHEDLKAALDQYGRALYIGSEELDEVIQLAERNAWRRRFGDIRCGDVMSRDLVTVAAGASLLEAWRLLRRHHLAGLPVVDSLGRLEGWLSLADFVRGAGARTPAGLRGALWRLLRHHMGRDNRVASIMTRPELRVAPDTSLAELVPALARGLHQVPVVDGNGKLLGVVTQSDMVAALYHGCLSAPPG